MDQWYVMDIFHQVFGPYDTQEVKSRVQSGSAIFVARPGMQGWLATEMVPEFQPPPGKRGGPGGAKPTAVETAGQAEKEIAKLMSLCKAMVADGEVDPKEAGYLKNWVEQNPVVSGLWPASVLYRRLSRIFEDGRVDAMEQMELTALVMKITAEKPPVAGVEKKAIQIPFDAHPPEVEIRGREFCLVGRFAHGTRDYCELEIVSQGGKCRMNPSPDTDYLVVGALGEEEGKAVSPVAAIRQVIIARKEKGGTSSVTAIISEEHWARSLA